MHSGWVIVAIVFAGGCSGYESSYQPPDAYRARAVWSDDGMKIVGMVQVPTCDLDSIAAEPVEVAPGESRDYDRMMTVGPHGNWIPITLVGWNYHHDPFAFLFPHQVIAEAIHIGSGHRVAGGTAGGGTGVSLGGSDEGAAYVLVVLAVVAILASSMIAVGLSVSDPEDGDEIAATIDEVNRINDEARQVMANCMQQLQGERP